MRQCGRLLIVPLIMAMLAFMSISTVSAHAAYKSSDPPANGTVQKAPAQVAITFSEETDPLKSGGSVTDAGGATVSTGFKVDLNQRTNMTIDLKPNLPNGLYTVKWNTFTDDDNGMANGTFTFTVQAVASAAASATITSTATTAPTATPAATTAPTATVAPTATRAATTAAATGVGGGTATGMATTLPATGNSGNGNGSPWIIWVALIGAFVLAIGLGVRARTMHLRR